MANVNIEFQGDFQYLKYEFTPRLRALIKNVHTVMNSYNAAFFERCKGFGDLESIKREALATGRLPQGVESAMKAAGALKPIAATTLLWSIANQIASFANFHFWYWKKNFSDNAPQQNGRNVNSVYNVMRSEFAYGLTYALSVPFLYRIGQGVNLLYYPRPEFVDFYKAKPFHGTNALTVEPMRFAQKKRTESGVMTSTFIGFDHSIGIDTSLAERLSTVNSGGTRIPFSAGVGSDNPYQTRKERLSVIFYHYFCLNNRQIAHNQPLKNVGNVSNYFVFSKKDFYTLSEECVIARFWNFFAKNISLNFDPSGREGDSAFGGKVLIGGGQTTSPVCDYYARFKKQSLQGTFEERLSRFSIPSTEILQVPELSDAEIQEGLALLEKEKRPFSIGVDLKTMTTGKELTQRSNMLQPNLMEKLLYYETKARTNHVLLVNKGVNDLFNFNTGIRYLPQL